MAWLMWPWCHGVASTFSAIGIMLHPKKLMWLKALPSGKLLHNYGKSPFLLGKLTISMAIFNGLLYVYQAG